jgi:outer membrane lipoprotein SlyB
LKGLKMNVQSFGLVAIVVGTALLAGCAAVPESSALNYNTRQAGVMQQVQLGTVISVTPVNIAPSTTGIGTVGGALAGGIIGSDIGQGRGSAVASIIGAIAGGIAGSAAEGHVLTQSGLQIVVRLDDGRTVAITQAADVSVRPGQRVQVIGSGYYGSGPVRVQPF